MVIPLGSVASGGRTLLALGCVVWALGTGGCAARTAEPPKPPPKQAHQDEVPKERTRVPHVAPPPAYGNKVVYTVTPVATGDVSTETL